MPQICVGEQQTEPCEMRITIHVPQHAVDNEFCVYADEKQLFCGTGSLPPQTVRLKHDSWIFIKNTRGDVIYSQKLLVKWKQKEKRKRVRDPWSLF
ncbi:DUF3019 domain-containing protein [Alteromonas sp. RKMC-009]|uniref:DUF3019 domain-containing protein n=1 Tax=Alteromonas sp. RKMC-009 TaxID=2267264 RepID=UPI0010C4818E|nr:DUF3019 domain-containing protein [Alteromonas sp. RKMC-009]AYA63324.2 DUF3019 domain-containing protein [Alteromonas sp. RKMC-009]MEC7690410.1 DUF3019 domain-containing protein [Pseudomonadota bacterium]